MQITCIDDLVGSSFKIISVNYKNRCNKDTLVRCWLTSVVSYLNDVCPHSFERSIFFRFCAQHDKLTFPRERFLRMVIDLLVGLGVLVYER